MPSPKISRAMKAAVANASAVSGRTRPPCGSSALGHLLPDELRARFERALVLALGLDVQLGHALAARGRPCAEPDGQLAADDEGRDRERRVQLILDRAARPRWR